MATVIDSLIVELGLDPTKLEEGYKRAGAAFLKGRESFTKDAKEVEGGANKMLQSFSMLQGRLLGIAALFLGGLGMKDFAERITKLTTDAGRLAYQLQINVNELGAWEGAGKRVGATTEDIAGSIANLTGTLQEFTITGNSPIVQYFNQMGIQLTDAKGKIKDTTQLLIEMSKWGQGRDVRQTTQWFKDMGMSPGMINLLLQGPDKVQTWLQESKKYAPTDEDVRKMTELQQAWAKTELAAEAAGRKLLVQFVPVLEKIADLVEKIAHPFTMNDKEKSDEFSKSANEHYGSESKTGWDRLKDWWNNDSTKKPSDSTTPSLPTNKSSGSTSAPLPTNRVETAKVTAQQFRDAGLPESGVAGILGNVQQESNFNSRSRSPDQPRFSGEAHYAHGLYQEGGTEWNNYSAWLTKNYPGRSWTDPRLQNEFLIQNLQKNYPRVWSKLKDPNVSVEEKTLAFQSGYLKPAAWAANSSGRIANAKRFMANPPSAPRTNDNDDWMMSMQPVPYLEKGNRVGARPGSSINSSTSNEVHVGAVTVNTQATDAYGIAKDLRPVLEGKKYMEQSNYGQN